MESGVKSGARRATYIFGMISFRLQRIAQNENVLRRFVGFLAGT